MRAFFKLAPASPSLVIGANQTLPWVGHADWLAVLNPTSSEVWIRVTGPDVPSSAATADYVVPPASAFSIPINSAVMALTLSSASLVATSGLLQQAYIIIGRAEPLPQMGSYQFASLGSSNLEPAPLALTNLTPSATVIGHVYDLNSWGGLVVSFIADPTATIRLTYSHSPDQVTWYAAHQVSILPGPIYTLQFPRYSRYARFQIDSPLGQTVAIVAYATIRATLSEISQLGVAASTGSVTPYSGIVDLASTFVKTWYTAGLQQVKFIIQATNALAINTRIDVLQSNDGITFDLLFRETLVLTGAGLPYSFSVSQPLPYIAINIFNTGGFGSGAGSVIVLPSYTLIPATYNEQLPVRAADGALATIGLTTDIATVASVMGRLTNISAQSSTIAAALATANALDSSGVSTSFITGIAAGSINTWVNTGITLPANSFILAASVGSSIANAYSLLGIGTGGVESIGILFGIGAQMSMANRRAIPVGANTQIFVQSSVAAQIVGTVWTGT